jgi:hypothetical protein
VEITRDVYRSHGEGILVAAMGNRVMERRNASGRTTSRHLVPRSVRRKRKRALRMTAGATRKVAKVAKPRILKPKAVEPKEARPKAAAVKPAAAKVAEPKAPERVPARTAGPVKPTGPAKTTGSAEKAASGTRQPVATPVEGQAKRKWFRRAPKAPVAEAPAPEKVELPAPEETHAAPPEKVPEPKREPLDYLEDGAVEWGIKRE